MTLLSSTSKGYSSRKNNNAPKAARNKAQRIAHCCANNNWLQLCQSIHTAIVWCNNYQGYIRRNSLSGVYSAELRRQQVPQVSYHYAEVRSPTAKATALIFKLNQCAWQNNNPTQKMTKLAVYQACVLSTPPYSSAALINFT